MIYHTFDTYNIIKRFVDSGIVETQAREIVNAIVESKDYDLSQLVTKSDLKAEIAEIRTEIATTRNEILKWVIGLNITTITAIIACFKLFIH